MTDPAWLTDALRSTAPFIRTLGLEVVALDDDHALLRLPHAEAVLNHVGGPHAGAIFSLGESAAAALMVQRFGSWLDRTVPLAVSGQIRWLRLARSGVTAEARMLRPAAEVLAELERGGHPEWDTRVVFRREDDGAECAEMTVVLTLRPRKD
jgi:uncharacterized protein (TIGR00369 family)